MRLRNRIRLQKFSSGVDAAGQPNGAWSDYRVCWGKVGEIQGHERNQEDDQKTALATVEVVMRTPQDGRIPQPTDRVIYRELGGNRTLNIASVARLDNQRRMLRLRCSEVQDG